MKTSVGGQVKPAMTPSRVFAPLHTGLLQRKCACGGTPGPAGECEECRKKGEPGMLQGKIAQPLTLNHQHFEVPAIVHEVLRSPGQPLDDQTRAFMEPRFIHDFSRVRIHADAQAAESARTVNALAYTVGRDVVFGEGQFVPQSHEGQTLIAHELTHVVQQQQHAASANLRIAPAHNGLEDEANSNANGLVATVARAQGALSSSALQRQPAPTTTEKKKKPTAEKKKPATTSPKLVFNEIKKRDPNLAELITPQSIDFNSPKEPPAIKGGPLKDDEEHIWKVSVTASQGFRGSQISAGAEEKKQLKSHTQVTHPINIVWALPLAPDAEFVKETSSEDEAFTLTAAEPLYHELLHARIMMESDAHWTSQHTQVFQEYSNILGIATSKALDKELQEVKKQIGSITSGGGSATTSAEIQKAGDAYYEFLVHEKYDADTEGKAFGKTYSNALIAKKYSEVVCRRLAVGDDHPAFRILSNQLASAAEKLFDKVDQASKGQQRGSGGTP